MAPALLAACDSCVSSQISKSGNGIRNNGSSMDGMFDGSVCSKTSKTSSSRSSNSSMDGTIRH